MASPEKVNDSKRHKPSLKKGRLVPHPPPALPAVPLPQRGRLESSVREGWLFGVFGGGFDDDAVIIVFRSCFDEGVDAGFRAVFSDGEEGIVQPCKADLQITGSVDFDPSGKTGVFLTCLQVHDPRAVLIKVILGYVFEEASFKLQEGIPQTRQGFFGIRVG